MIRTLRAFAWMRWRVLMNALDRTGARDRLERLSLAVDQLAPLIAVVLFVPMAIMLTGLGAYAGYSLATSPTALTFEVIRFLLVLATAACVVGPLVMPSLDRTAAVRLLLLPIRREVLYIAQASGALSEPWVLLALAPVLALPFGIAAGGAIGSAAIALIAGVFLLLTLVSIVTLATTILHLILRDRRRGELVTLIFIIVIPVLSMMPGLLMAQTGGRAERRSQRSAPAEPTVGDENSSAQRAAHLGRRAFAGLPSELFARATRSSVKNGAPSAVIPIAALAATAVGLHAIAFFLFGKLLDSPESSSRSRTGGPGMVARIRIPGLSRGAAAVAQAHIRLVFRTPRGRASLVTPVVVFGAIAVVARQTGSLKIPVVALSDGLSLATFGASVALLSILPIAMNQFAIDRAGVTLALLMPLDTRQLLTGKAVANGMVVAVPTLLCVALAAALFPAGDIALWISLPLGLLATYLLVVPMAALLSAIFPRAVDLNSIGSRSNPHGVAGTVGLFSFGAASLPPAFLAMLTIAFERTALTPVLIGAWCVLALILSKVLLNAVAVVFDKRRENLALVTRPKS